MTGMAKEFRGGHDQRVSTPPAPTSRLGDGRRRLPFTVGVAFALGLGLSACGGPWMSHRSAVPAGPVGQVIGHPDAIGPDIECRGVARERCVSAGAIEDAIAGFPLTDIERVIVSCEGAPCTAAGGAMRIDLLLHSGSTVEVARGGYGEFRQP
jgi:hypothetical protein